MAMQKPFRLIVARNVMNENEEEIKYFVSNAPLETAIGEVLSPQNKTKTDCQK